MLAPAQCRPLPTRCAVYELRCITLLVSMHERGSDRGSSCMLYLDIFGKLLLPWISGGSASRIFLLKVASALYHVERVPHS